MESLKESGLLQNANDIAKHANINWRLVPCTRFPKRAFRQHELTADCSEWLTFISCLQAVIK